ncbi:MAG: SMP-30/gluconolactonase/LRE family protein [Planctomycetaceae bacterium]|nr:SMP-30/gluconolactonase/LRE family protein [Planctomycetaceae bacterium]
MARLLTVICCLLLAHNAIRAAEPMPPAGFRALFNGRDLNGWYGLNPHAVGKLEGEKREANLKQQRADFPKHWTVEDGELVNPGTGPYATTDEEFGDIELHIEYKTVPKADSGIYLRGTPQVQIWDVDQLSTPKNPDRNPNRGSGGLFNNTPRTPGRDPLELADKPHFQWNSFRIRQIGARTWVWLNDRLVVGGAPMENYWDRSKPLPAKGPIMLQTHGGEIRWRNIYVREIKPDEAKQILSDADATSSVIPPDGKPVMLQERGAGEGPAWHPELGLLTSGDGHIMRRALDGKVSVHLKGAGTNGLLFDREGRLVMCEPVKRSVSRIEANGTRTVLADKFEGKAFNQPNDLTIDSQGRIYFSDPCYGDRSKMELIDAQDRKVEGVYRIDPDGRITRVITHEVDRPNGLIVTPDDKYLFVADNNNDTVGGARKLWRFELRSDGSVDYLSQRLVHDWKQTRGPDGMKLDSKGRLFVAAGLVAQNPPYETQDKPTAGVYVFTANGALLEFIPIPRDECTNVAFGGPDLKTLYVTAGGTLWSVPMRYPGRVVWPK